MGIVTRLMEPDEAEEVKEIRRRAFGAVEGCGGHKPRQAMVALAGGRIVGAVKYRYYRAGGKKIGYVAFAAVDPDCQGRGVGGVLYKAAVDDLWSRGCDALTAIVKDDNAGSWSLFLKNGFARIGMTELARQFGLRGFLQLFCFRELGGACGMDYYVALRDRACPSGKGGCAGQIAAYFMVNLLLALLLLFRRRESRAIFFAAYNLFLACGVLAGFVGTRFSKRSWSFRTCNCGGLLYAFANLMGVMFPVIGNWYPDRYEKSDGFRRDMGIQALTGWLFVLALTLCCVFADGRRALYQHLGEIGSAFLLYHILILPPFEAFGGGRVCHWNRGIYLLMAALSAAAILLFAGGG